MQALRRRPGKPVWKPQAGTRADDVKQKRHCVNKTDCTSSARRTRTSQLHILSFREDSAKTPRRCLHKKGRYHACPTGKDSFNAKNVRSSLQHDAAVCAASMSPPRACIARKIHDGPSWLKEEVKRNVEKCGLACWAELALLAGPSWPKEENDGVFGRSAKQGTSIGKP